ncbi:MAG: hypothetical protein RLZZ58_1773 [Pseudomonadota bacterium]
MTLLCFAGIAPQAHAQSLSGLTVMPVLPNDSSLNAAADAADLDGRTIIVTGTLDGYRTVETTTGMKTNTPIIDVPQSISVVTDQQIADQAIRSMTDLVRLIPGVSAAQGEGHRDQIVFRGNSSTADFFVDGLRDDVQYFRSFYNIDRVEVHKGPNAMIFGRGGGGGLVNRVTKGALIGETALGAAASLDSFGSWYGSADVNVNIGPTSGLRINGTYESLDNHRDAFGGERYAVNPVVGAELGDAVKVELGYEYVRDARVVDRGIPSAFAGTIANPAGPLRGYRDAFFGVRGINAASVEGHMVRFRGEAALTDSLKITAQALYSDFDKIYTNVFPVTGVNSSTSPATLAVEAYRDPSTRQSVIGQANLEWRGATGAVDHVILIGTEYTGQDSYNERINGFFDNSLNAASRRRTITLSQTPVLPMPIFVAGPTGNSNRAATSDLAQFSLYAQDQIGIGAHFDIIAGLRYDRFDLTGRNLFTNAAFGRVDNLWSPRLGLVYKPVEDASIYVSYSKSYLPQAGDQFTTLDLSLAALEPERFENYEFGAKWNVKPGLTATAAIFQLDRTNTRAAGPVPGTIVLTGAQRTKGFEAGLSGRVLPGWDIAAGYSWTDAKILQTTTAAPAGRRIAQVPRHHFNLWNRVDLNDRWGAGLGIYYQSSSFANISNVTRLPGFWRFDGALFYTINDRVDVQLNVENITGTVYFPVAHNDNNISTGAPRNARLTVRFKL